MTSAGREKIVEGIEHLERILPGGAGPPPPVREGGCPVLQLPGEVGGGVLGGSSARPAAAGPSHSGRQGPSSPARQGAGRPGPGPSGSGRRPGLKDAERRSRKRYKGPHRRPRAEPVGGICRQGQDCSRDIRARPPCGASWPRAQLIQILSYHVTAAAKRWGREIFPGEGTAVTGFSSGKIHNIRLFHGAWCAILLISLNTPDIRVDITILQRRRRAHHEETILQSHHRGTGIYHRWLCRGRELRPQGGRACGRKGPGGPWQWKGLHGGGAALAAWNVAMSTIRSRRCRQK